MGGHSESRPGDGQQTGSRALHPCFTGHAFLEGLETRGYLLSFMTYPLSFRGLGCSFIYSLSKFFRPLLPAVNKY